MEENVEKKVRGVYEHPKGSKVYWIQYFDQGRRRRERAGTKSNAIKLYQKRKTAIFSGEKLPELTRRRTPFGDLLDDVLEYARENKLEMRNYETKAVLFRKAFGTASAESLSAEDFSAWLRKRGVGPASYNRYRSFLSVCFREAIRRGKLKTNPIQLLPLKREPRGRKRFLSREEFDQVLEAIRETQPPHRAVEFIVSVYTGMRLSEQFNLQWKHLNFQTREISVLDTKNGDDRTIPMASLVHDTLLAHRPPGAKPRSPVFVRPRGGKGIAHVRWFTQLLKGAELDIEDYTWHNNRHTFCSWLAMAGSPLKAIQELAGHRTISMTARYSHLSPDHKVSEIERLVTGGKPKVVSITRSATGTANS